MKKINFLSLFFLSLLFSTRVALAAPYGEYRVTPRQIEDFSVLGGNSGQVLKYYGGPVISHVKVFIVYWGDQVGTELEVKLAPFYRSILDSGYMDVLAQYKTDIPAVDGRKGTGQTIGHGQLIGQKMIEPRNQAATLTDRMIQKELSAQIASGVLPSPDANTLYMVYFPRGIRIKGPGGSGGSCETFDAYHDGFKTSHGDAIFYGVMPDCGLDFAGATEVSSHETIEAVTDPFPTPGNHPSYPQAWNSIRGDEVADLCQTRPPSYVSGSVTSVVARPWDNSIGACAKGPWTDKTTLSVFRSSAIHAKLFPILNTLPALTPNALWEGR
jgi:hypothetical protein